MKGDGVKRFYPLLIGVIMIIGWACSDDGGNNNPVGPGSSSGLAVVNTGGDDESNIAVIDYVNNKAYIDLLPLSGTAEFARFGGYVYIIDKDGDRIIKFDPVSRTPVGELSTGPNSAPESIAFLSASKAYVSLSDSATVKVINPSSMRVITSINIASLADADGDPDQGNAVIRDGKLYVALRRSNGSKLTDHSGIAVINTANDTLLGEIVLKTNGIAGAGKQSLGTPCGGANTVEGDLFASMIGSVSKANDGAVERIDTGALSSAVIMTEGEIGGNVSNWVFETPTTGWAIVGLSTTSGGQGWGLRRFDLNARTFTEVSSFQKSPYCWALDYTDDGLVLVGSQDENNPGVWVFDSRNGYQPVFEKPINVGLLAKRLIVVR